MKKLFLQIATLLLPFASFSQNYIQGSIQKGAADNEVDITFLPNFNSSGEHVNYISISIAIDTAYASGATPTITMTGTFSTISVVHAIPFSYNAGGEKIYSWVYSGGSGSAMSWSNGTQFTGATITFTGHNDSAKVRMVDFTNYSPSGGSNSNTYFFVVTNKFPYFDVTDYSALFYSISDPNGSTTGTYGNGDQYVETNLKINLHSDGEFSRSSNPPPIFVENKKETLSIGGVFPNPVNTIATILINAPAKDQLSFILSDINGKVISQKRIFVETGENKIPVNLIGLPSSIYLVRLLDNKSNTLKVFKLIKH